MTSIIFLDIDGVLNSQQESICRNIRGTCDYEGLNRAGIGLLRLLCDLTGAKIVISSTWRSDGKDAIAGGFEANGWRGIILNNTIIDVTPHLPGIRGNEIQDWLVRHPDCTDYVIIDDDSDMLESQISNFVNTDNVIGFTLYDMVKAVDILGVIDDEDKISRAKDLRRIVEFKQNRRLQDSCNYTI